MGDKRPRYKLVGRSLPELMVFKLWLQDYGCGRRDAIYVAVCQHIAEEQIKQARSKAAFKRLRRESK